MTSNPCTIKAGCKVNLSLDIVGIRENGFHELDTLFYPLPEPSDLVTISPAPAGTGIGITSDVPGLDGEANIMTKAWKAFARATGFAPDLHVGLQKNIPMGAGLGGGSSDAAVLLDYLNRNAGQRALGRTELMRLAAKVGADVPFFLLGEPAWASGIGDVLTPAETNLSGLFAVLACPHISVSTAWAYAAWDTIHAGESLDSLTWPLTDIKKVNFSEAWLRNAFEEVVFLNYPTIRKLKERLLASGACGAVMSGSGSSVFALFRGLGEARKAAQAAGPEMTVHVLEL